MSSLAVFDESRTARGIAVGILAVIPMLAVMAASRLGPGMTNDSVAYAAAARSFVDTGALTTIGGAPLTHFPPGLPALLGALGRIGLDIEASSVVLNVALVALTVVGTYWLADEALDAPALALVPAAIVSVSTATTMTFSRLWTEPAFVVLVLVILIALTRAVRGAVLSVGTVLVVAAAASLALVWRLVGVMLIPFAALGGALAQRRRGVRSMVLGALLLGAASSVGLIVVMARNAMVASTAIGTRPAPRANIRGTLVDTIDTLGSYVVPDPAARLNVLLGLPIAALLAVGAWRVYRTRDARMAMPTAFIAAYWLALVVTGRVMYVEEMRYRIVAPAFAPLVILATFAARDLLGRLSGARATALKWALAAALVLALPLALAQTAAYSWITSRSGHGYNSTAALRSPLAAAVAALPADARVVTNDANQLYWSADRRSASLGEARRDPSSAAYLALFDDQIPGTARGYVADPAEQGGPMTLVESFEDGRLYVLAPGP